MLAASSLAALGGAAALAGVARTPIQVGVTVTQPCDIVTPSISVDAAGRASLGAPVPVDPATPGPPRAQPPISGPVEPVCGQAAPPQISVQADPSKGYGYVVSISF